jgi:hypothetical protein
MNEIDFIFAWLLATRAGRQGEWAHTDAHIAQAKAIYRIITEGAANAVDSREEN